MPPTNPPQPGPDDGLVERLQMLRGRANRDGAETADRFAYRSELEIHAPAMFDRITALSERNAEQDAQLIGLSHVRDHLLDRNAELERMVGVATQQAEWGATLLHDLAQGDTMVMADTLEQVAAEIRAALKDINHAG